MLARLAEQDEEFLLHTGLFANKRVRVVQLLMIGLVGLLFGWLGNFFVSSSCYFASIDVNVGEDSDVFSLRFGIWNYSPVDSALNGYKYCYPYGGSHVGDAPVVSRIANVLALALGTYSLVVLWCYLITGRAASFLWKVAVYAAFLAGICQLFTLYFFFGTMCRTKDCEPGPGALTSIVTAIAWIVLGAELHYNCPIPSDDDDVDDVLVSLSTSASFVTTTVAGSGGHQRHSQHGRSSSNGGSGGGERIGLVYPSYQHRSESPTTTTSTTSGIIRMSNLEMADIASASNEYFERFNKKKRRGYRPPVIT